MENEKEDEKEIESPVEVKIRKPWDSLNLSYRRIAREDFYPYQNEEQWSAESNEIIRKHNESRIRS